MDIYSVSCLQDSLKGVVTQSRAYIYCIYIYIYILGYYKLYITGWNLFYFSIGNFIIPIDVHSPGQIDPPWMFRPLLMTGGEVPGKFPGMNTHIHDYIYIYIYI